MELLQLQQHDAMDVQVATLLLALGTHHVHQLGVPAVELTALRFAALAIARQDEPFYALHVYTCSTDEVLHLPHVEQVFDDVLLALSLGYVHGSLTS